MSYTRVVKGKSVTFRPQAELRSRLDQLAVSTDRTVTWLIQKCIESYLPELEAKYAAELRSLEKRKRLNSASGDTERLILGALEKDEPAARPKAKR